ncbi:ShlB/FhaC/HecB family hemolysin secretion/activation protein [Synechococcus sp. NOUM97013]|uniref:ShlB/FhaC/HecB family hemolysin secretion/activation protein n=1 Tax=Synechococcus sp. NOUM97013 TaxID=1442555 RepID=UPI001646A72A|nr:ShlB/FhaC/HecB family hemolysin secretion/activation protein [Synechococcus sp. NOUM97013]QNI74825.1 polypeptide-transport-associated protein/ ShlB-type [Synechococcus sp. NOUM97013]
MLLLLAQLASPPIQPGPARLPAERAPNQQPRLPSQTDSETTPSITLPSDEPLTPAAEDSSPAGHDTPGSSRTVNIVGDLPYSNGDLSELLERCSKANDQASRLQQCAEALTGLLQKDGYVNSRVYVEAEPAPGQLNVVMGQLVELRIESENAGLEQRVRQRLSPLLNRTLNLPDLQQQLLLLKQRSVVGTVAGSLGKLGSDPTQAVLNLVVTPAKQPWRGDLSMSNDGNAGSGEWRSVAVLQKPTLLTNGDVFQFYGELSADGTPELGTTLGSLSYTYPISESWTLTGSFGASRRKLVEAKGAANDLSFRQFQGLAQLQWTFAESSNQTWYASAGLSINRNNSYLDGDSVPLIIGGGPDGDLTTGYLRLGLGHGGNHGNLGWNAQIYGLQGIAGLSSQTQLEDFSFFGIHPGESRALGGVASLGWTMQPNLQLNLRASGQVAFNELTSDMGFGLGSDVGLRGLPGTLISGDNGWLSTGELNWTFWQNSKNALQLVPFMGIGGIQTTRDSVTMDDTIGTGGLLLRWLRGQHWSVEVGWVDQFNANDNVGIWNDWLIGSGAYGKVRYRF